MILGRIPPINHHQLSKQNQKFKIEGLTLNNCNETELDPKSYRRDDSLSKSRRSVKRTKSKFKEKPAETDDIGILIDTLPMLDTADMPTEKSNNMSLIDMVNRKRRHHVNIRSVMSQEPESPNPPEDGLQLLKQNRFQAGKKISRT